MSGTGNYAELIAKRFDIACRKYGLNEHGAGRAAAPSSTAALQAACGSRGQMTLVLERPGG